MKGTNQKILRAARFLFNQNGVANVSQRAISDHIAISPGNLTYHFNKREEIIEAIYAEFSQELKDALQYAEGQEANLQTLLDFSKTVNKTLFENRFFMIDFVQITRNNNRIRKDYVSFSVKREKFIQNTLALFVKNGIIRKEELPNEYEYLGRRLQLVNDFWITYSGTTKEDLMLKHTRIYSEIVLQSIYPYLTSKGKDQFKTVISY